MHSLFLVNFEQKNRDIIDVCKLLVLHAHVGGGLQPSLPGQSKQLLRQLLNIFVLVAGVVQELRHLLI